MSVGIVYEIENRISRKRYVGKTKRTLSQRWKEHVYHAQKGSERMVLYAAIRKHGPESFDCRVLEHCSSEHLDEAESNWIQKLNTLKDGYNSTEGGDGISGYKHTDEARHRMSEARKGEKNHNYGKVWGKTEWSAEERKKLSQDRLGEGNPMYGRVHTEKARRKISKTMQKRRDGTPVIAFDKSGNEVARYVSMKEAAKAVCGQANKIYEVCSGNRQTHKGLRWQYASSDRYRLTKAGG